MSFILDALRRADAERTRERQTAPSLYAPGRELPGFDDADDLPERPRRPVARALWWGLAGFVIAAVAISAWLTWPAPAERSVASVGGAVPGRTDAQPATPAASAGPIDAAPPAARAMNTTPPGALATSPSASTPATLAPPATTAGTAPATAATPSANPQPAPASPPGTAATPGGPTAKPAANPAPARPMKAGREGAPPARAGAVADAARQGAAGAPAAAPDPVQPPAAAGPVARLKDLPDGLRRELPPLAVNGAMYAPERRSRMIVLDGQVLREGQGPRPGLVVEQIGPKSAVLSIRGKRFELPY